MNKQANILAKKGLSDNLKSLLPLSIKLTIKYFVRTIAGQVGVLPNFIIVGAQRCGTTSLYVYLTRHVSIMPAAKKELHFFDVNFRQGVGWYRAQFPSIFEKFLFERVYGRDLVTGESSPYYLFHPYVPVRIRQVIPDVKLIVLLRNPVDRAYSQYNYNLEKGYERLSFEEAIEKEGERLEGEPERLFQDPEYRSFNHQHFSYLSRGKYVKQLRHWMTFFPKDQFLILKSERFYSDPSVILERVFSFLGLPEVELEEYKIYNFTTRCEKMQATTRKKLVDFFEPYNQELYKYLSVDFGWDS